MSVGRGGRRGRFGCRRLCGGWDVSIEICIVTVGYAEIPQQDVGAAAADIEPTDPLKAMGIRMGKMIGKNLTLCNMHSMSRKPSPLGHQPALLDEQSRNLSRDKLIGDRFPADRMQLVGVGNIPSSRRITVIVCNTLAHSCILGLFGIECIAVHVFSRAYFAGPHAGIYLEDGVGMSVDLRIDAQTEEVLVVVGVHFERMCVSNLSLQA